VSPPDAGTQAYFQEKPMKRNMNHPRTPASSRGRVSSAAQATPVGPPTNHHLAVMIWIAAFPTLTILNLTLGHWLVDLGPVLRTLVLATIAVPIVIYGLMPQLHKARVRLLTRNR
jgi:antibiotic biosynthesis monooxygenase (ABM) superfamily enzyme